MDRNWQFEQVAGEKRVALEKKREEKVMGMMRSKKKNHNRSQQLFSLSLLSGNAARFQFTFLSIRRPPCLLRFTATSRVTTSLRSRSNPELARKENHARSSEGQEAQGRKGRRRRGIEQAKCSRRGTEQAKCSRRICRRCSSSSSNSIFEAR